VTVICPRYERCPGFDKNYARYCRHRKEHEHNAECHEPRRGCPKSCIPLGVVYVARERQVK
jgi:hypothetical protein